MPTATRRPDHGRWLLAALMLGAACSGSNPPPDGGTGGGGGGGGGSAGGGAGGGGAPAGGGSGGGGGAVSECDQPQNVARKNALLAAQPALGVRSKQALTVPVTFPSEAGDPSVSCTVELKFRDASGDGALTDYEDWRSTPAQRTAALLARMTQAQKLALMVHPGLTDVPVTGSTGLSTATAAVVDRGVRFGRTAAFTAAPGLRATWANTLQERCEAAPLGIPFVLSSEAAHSSGNGRVKAKGFSQWPAEAGLAASDDLAEIEGFGRVLSQEYRAIGVRMALSASADLATEPRWYQNQFTFGEDAEQVSARVAALVKGAQGATLGPDSVAVVVGQFPGAGAAKSGWDARLMKGRWLSWPASGFDVHASAFEGAFAAQVAGVMPAYGMPERGAWTGLNGAIDGATVSQYAVSFHTQLLRDALRTHYHYPGLVLAPFGAMTDQAWGQSGFNLAARIGAAVNAGVDQLGGLDDPQPLAEAVSGSNMTAPQVEAAAARALALSFALGLFENPYVDATKAPALCNSDTSYRAGLNAMNAGMVLLVNKDKPAGWLNGNGDGTQLGDKGNAGNGSLKVLPAPPGEPYVSAGCSYYILGNFDLDYVRSVSTGYGELTNDATVIKGVPVSTAAQRIALSDYVLVRIAAPYTVDPDSGPLALPLQSLEYATNLNHAELDPLAFARSAIDGWTGSPASQTQLVVGVDLGRPSVVSEVLQYNPSALYVQWAGTMPANAYADKVFLDVAFGIVNGSGKLPVGLPLSDTAAAAQKCDLAGDGQHSTFVKGFGLTTRRFE